MTKSVGFKEITLTSEGAGQNSEGRFGEETRSLRAESIDLVVRFNALIH